MAPTICSGKKRQTHTIATTNIRRRGQGSHQLNQTLSNIVNFVAKGSMNPRASASLRIRTHNQTAINTNNMANCRSTNHEADLNYNNQLKETNGTSVSYRRRQQFSFISDNAVTSSTHSDTENTFDLRLANENEIVTNDSTATRCSDTTNPSNSTSLSPSLLSEATLASSSSSSSSSLSSSPLATKGKTSSPITQCRERIFQRYSTVMQANDDDDDDDDDDVDYKEMNNNKKLNSNRETNEIIHSSNLTARRFSCDGFHFDEEEEEGEGEGEDDDEDEYEDEESENARELNGGRIGIGSDTDMDTNESDSMTSLDTEKSVKLKIGNHPLLRDKLFAERLTKNNSNNTKPFDTDGLLSIAIKTIKLVKRNQLLQQRLTQLQLETSEFIQSVLANPENRHFRENIKQKVQ